MMFINLLQLDYRILQMLDGGLGDHWYKRSQSKTSATTICIDSQRDKRHGNLEMHDFASVFMLLVIGLCLATAAFFLEIVYHSIHT